jgi:3-hydroxybutyryl-CoA dehydrogenase
MGAGIAQVAACAGHRVLLADALPGAAAGAAERIGKRVAELVAKGKLQLQTPELDIGPVEIEAMGNCSLIIEAVTERLDVKGDLFCRLESIVGETAVLASNTSSLSLAAIAARLEHPERFLGLHFFNPVPLMRLVEVIPGPATEPRTADRARTVVGAWGKQAVISAPTPGFIVNRVARPFYAESWRLLEEQAATAEVIDQVMVAAGQFPMGPFTLMDLIGHDVNEAVTRTVWESFGYDEWFAPSLTQRLLVESGRFGRKTGRGIYDYTSGTGVPVPQPAAPRRAPAFVTATDDSELRPLITRSKVPVMHADAPTRLPSGTIMARCDGRSATALAYELGSPVVVVDRCVDDATATGVAIAASGNCGPSDLSDAIGLLQACGLDVYPIADVPGLVLTRTVAMLANLALDAVGQKVASAADIDIAMKLGTGYPIGPLEWCDRWGARTVLRILDELSGYYRNGRYRASPALRRRALAERLTR